METKTPYNTLPAILADTQEAATVHVCVFVARLAEQEHALIDKIEACEPFYRNVSHPRSNQTWTVGLWVATLTAQHVSVNSWRENARIDDMPVEINDILVDPAGRHTIRVQLCLSARIPYGEEEEV